MSENRKFNRVDKQLVVSVSDENLFSYKDDSESRNFSVTGIQIKSPVQVGVGIIRTCKINAPNLPSPIETVVKIVWEKKEKEGWLIGLKFLDISEAQIDKIRLHILKS